MRLTVPLLVAASTLLLLVPTSARETGNRDNEKDLPNLDESRVDDLGWTDAHRVAFGSPIRQQNGRKTTVPHGTRSRIFLESASDEYLCLRNDFGQTALHLAVREDHSAVVRLYVDRRLPCLSSGNNDGDTPLHYAAYWGRTECARALLAGGAEAEARNEKGWTPLDDAREAGHREIASLLTSSKGEL